MRLKENKGTIDLPQIYSPWAMGVGQSPAYSPANFFLNISNFSSFDHMLSPNFCGSEKGFK